ncbi:MAG: hypothetical protein HUU37_05210 [Bdellovibrionales bacterium]|nr:hypothetical protein [Bdellovibrionales bacterium]
MARPLLLMVALLTASCGVKGPPVPVIRPETPPPLQLDCSPEDPKCDRTDPRYVPQKNR